MNGKEESWARGWRKVQEHVALRRTAHYSAKQGDSQLQGRSKQQLGTPGYCAVTVSLRASSTYARAPVTL